MNPEPMRIHQLTKEMVAEELRRLGDPCAAAAAVVRKTLAGAFGGAPEGTRPETVVEDAVKGAMTALLLADQNIPRGALLILEAVVEIAAERQLDPTETMRAALRGLADLRRFVGPDRLDTIRIEIDARYMGAGEVFNDYARAPFPGSTPPVPARPG